MDRAGCDSEGHVRCRRLARGRDEEDTKVPPNSLLFRGVWKGIGDRRIDAAPMVLLASILNGSDSVRVVLAEVRNFYGRSAKLARKKCATPNGSLSSTNPHDIRTLPIPVVL